MKKALSILLVLTMLLSLCACGGESTTEPKESNDAIIGVPEETSPETAAPSTSPTETPTKPTETETPTEAPKPTETPKPTTPPATEAPKPTETQKPATHTHSYGEWKTVTAATCTTSGVKQRSCSCGDIQKETIPATGHKEVVDKAVAATCTKSGLTEGKHCSTCKAVLVKQEEVAIVAHKYEKGTCVHCGQSQPTSNGLEYRLNSDGESYYVAGFGGCKDTDIVIPSTYKGKSVTEIGTAAFDVTYNGKVLTSITIPDSVTKIGYAAFRHCAELTSITIPDSVSEIGGYAFIGCSELTSAIIGNGVTKIGEGAFGTCSKLTNITIPGSVIEIDKYAFRGCCELTSVTFCNGVKSIGKSIFTSCDKLTSITIPNSVTKIGAGAFEYCKSVTDVYYDGTYEQWNAISKPLYWVYQYANYTVHCTDGDFVRYE